MDIIKAAEDLRELEEAESFEEYIKENKDEIYEILNAKAEELIEQGVDDIKQSVTDYFIELLNEKAHGREDAYRTIYVLTEGGQGVDYAKHLDIPEDSAVAKKIVKGIEIVEKVSEVKDVVENAVSWYNDLNELNSLMDENGKFGAAGKEKLEGILFQLIAVQEVVILMLVIFTSLSSLWATISSVLTVHLFLTAWQPLY